MNEEFRVFYHGEEFEEPAYLVYKGKEYQWNGAFLMDIDDLKQIDINYLPHELDLQAVLKRPKKDVVELAEYTIKKTDKGLVVYVQTEDFTKYWGHPVISLECYAKNKVTEIEADSEFILDFYEDEDPTIIELCFHFYLPGVESMEEVIKITEQSLAALERRVRWRIANEVKEWAEEVS